MLPYSSLCGPILERNGKRKEERKTEKKINTDIGMDGFRDHCDKISNE